MFVGTTIFERGIWRYAVVEVGMLLEGALTVELGVVCRLWDCLPSRPLLLVLPASGGMFDAGLC